MEHFYSVDMYGPYLYEFFRRCLGLDYLHLKDLLSVSHRAALHNFEFELGESCEGW